MIEIDKEFWIGRYVEIVTWKEKHILGRIIDVDHNVYKTEQGIISRKDVKEMEVIDLWWNQ